MGDKRLGSTVGNQDKAAQAEPARPQPLPRRAPRPDLARLRDTPVLPPALTTAAARRCDRALALPRERGRKGVGSGRDGFRRASPPAPTRRAGPRPPGAGRLLTPKGGTERRPEPALRWRRAATRALGIQRETHKPPQNPLFSAPKVTRVKKTNAHQVQEWPV